MTLMSRSNVLGLAAIFAVMFFAKGCNDKPATTAPKVQAAAAPAEAKPTILELKISAVADMAAHKRHQVLFESINSPRVILYATQATHPACNINGKPMQVAQIGASDFTCYRWLNGGERVALAMGDGKMILMKSSEFRPR